MATDNRYSRFVQFAKIVFPIVALGLLSTLFLFSRTLDPSQGIIFADFDVAEVAREQRLASPKFSGVTSDGSEVRLIADSAIPDPENPRRFTAEVISATIQTQDGPVYDVTARAADYDGTTENLILKGDVKILTSDGYRLESEMLRTNIKETTLDIPAEVRGFGPDATIRANGLRLEKRDDSQVLVFKGDVKLVYQPGK